MPYEITEYWPNYIEKPDKPRVAYVSSLDELDTISWLNKSRHGWRHDGCFIRQADSPWVIAIIKEISNGKKTLNPPA